jgi:hypothetical protein
MAILRMSLCGLSLCAVILLWPLPSPAGQEKEEMCRKDMGKIYESIATLYRLELLKQQTNPNSPARKFMDKSLPQFKEKCGPLEASSVRDLENGKYFHDMVAYHEKLKKSHSHIKDTGAAISDSESVEDLSLQR